MATKTLTVNGQPFYINRDRKAGVTEFKNNETKVQGNPFVRLGTLGSFSATSNSFSSGTNSSGSTARVGVILNRALTVSETAETTVTITGTVDSITASNGIVIGLTQGTTGGGGWTPNEFISGLTTTGSFTRTFSCTDSPQKFLQGINFFIENGEAIAISNLSVIVSNPNINTYIANRTAPVIDSDPVGKSRPLLGKLVGDAAAAYSLRDLNTKQGDTDVVNVRRSLDNSEKIFKAKDVPTIEDWVSGKQDTTLPASEDEAQAIRIVGGNQVADVYVSTSLTNGKPVYFSTTLSTKLKLVFTSSNPRWLLQNASTSQAFVASTSTGEDEAFPTKIQDLSTYFSGTGTKEITSITPASPAAAAYSLRKVKANYGEEVVLLDGLSEIQASASSGIPIAETKEFLSNGLSVKMFMNGGADSFSATKTDSNTLKITFTKASNSDGLQPRVVVRFEGLTVGKHYLMTGEVAVKSIGSNANSHARFDISDANAGNEQIGEVVGLTDGFVPFSVGGHLDASSSSAEFADIGMFGADTSTTGTLTAEFRNIKIIENPNIALRIRRKSDNTEALVGFDSDNKVSLNSPIKNQTEGAKTTGGGRPSDKESGSTSATDLNGFLNETTNITATGNFGNKNNSSIRVTNTEFSATTLDFTVSALENGSGASTTNAWILKNENHNNVSTGEVRFSFDVTHFNKSNSGTFNMQPVADINGNGSAGYPTLIAINSTGSYSFTQTLYSSTSTGFRFFANDIAVGDRIRIENFKVEALKTSAFVHTWYDQAGSNNAVQETAANQPKIAENGALLADGLKFDGSNDMLTNSNVGAMQASDGISSFTVHKKRVASTSNTFGDDNPQYLYHLCEDSLGTTVLAHRILGGRINSLRVIQSTITGAALASNVVTITTSSAHQYSAGDSVVIKDIGFSGTDPNTSSATVLASGLTSTQFKYDLVGSDETYTTDSDSRTFDFISSRSDSHIVKTNKLLSSTMGAATMNQVQNGASFNLDLNNSGNPTINSSTTEFTIGGQDGIGGGTRHYDGHMEELILYNSDQSANRFKIESNINNYYGLYNDELNFTSVISPGTLPTAITKSDGTVEMGSTSQPITTNSKNSIKYDYNSGSHGTGNVFTRYMLDSGSDFIGLAQGDTIQVSLFVEELTSGVTLKLILNDNYTALSDESDISSVGFHSLTLTRNSTSGTEDNLQFKSLGLAGAVNISIKDIKVSRIARDGFVETWHDQSGHDRHASQTEEQAQPYIVRNGGSVKTTKGFYAVDQDGRKAGSGVNQKAGLKTEYNPTGTDGALTEYSLFALYELYSSDSTSVNTVLFASGGAVGNASYGGLVLRNTSGSRIILNNTDGNAYSGGSSSSTTSIVAATASNSTAYGSIYGCHLIAGHFKHGVGMITREDGVTSADVQPNAPIPHASNSTNQGKVLLMAEFTYQQTNPWQGRASEFIFYEKDHRLNTEAIEANINNQYQIYS